VSHVCVNALINTSRAGGDEHTRMAYPHEQCSKRLATAGIAFCPYCDHVCVCVSSLLTHVAHIALPLLRLVGKDYECALPAADSTTPVATIDGYIKLANNDYNSVMNAMATIGPLAINVDASTWHAYESGIFNGCNQVSFTSFRCISGSRTCGATMGC
jgi:hypothetical protein